MTYSEINHYAYTHRFVNSVGLQYNKLASMSGINQSTIDNIVRGITANPRIQTLHHIAIGLNMTLSEFLNFEQLNDYSFEESKEEVSDTTEIE